MYFFKCGLLFNFFFLIILTFCINLKVQLVEVLDSCYPHGGITVCSKLLLWVITGNNCDHFQAGVFGGVFLFGSGETTVLMGFYLFVLRIK